MNKSWHISGQDAHGLAEDYVNLHQGPKGVLLTFVIKRDVDEQLSEPPGLSEADFENAEPTKVTDLVSFQNLVDEKFTKLDSRHKVGRWFELGVQEALDNQSPEDDEVDDEDYETEEE